jgi:uncharacterized protein YceK
MPDSIHIPSTGWRFATHTALLLAAGLLSGCAVVRDADDDAGDGLARRWRSMTGQRVGEVTLWATPSHLASPSLCFAPAPDGAWMVREVGSDHVALDDGTTTWLLPLDLVQLRIPSSR